MANIKITDLDAYADPKSTDVLPAVDVTNDETKKVSIADLMENAGSGTEALPGIAFDGDPNTGIYRPEADQIAISTGGEQRLLISNTGAVTIPGDLTVQGTTTTIDTTNLIVEDKNIEMGSVATPTDTTADGGGITLKGATDKTLNWVNSTDSWTSSENVDLASGKTYKIAGTDVLSGSTLGSGVTGSSLTSVGTITTGVWNGTALTADAIGADAINGSKIADDSIDSEHYVDGSIDGVHLSADCVDGTKIADDSIDSEHYVDGSIDNVHVSASAAIAGTKISADFGAQNLTVDSGVLFVDATNDRVGINNTSPDGLLHVMEDSNNSNGTDNANVYIESVNRNANLYLTGSASTTGAIYFGDQDNALTGRIIYLNSNNSLYFATNGSAQDVTIDSSGRLLVGTNSSLSENSGLQVASAAGQYDARNAQFLRFDSSDNTGGPTVYLTRSKSDTIGTISAVDANDGLGEIRFSGAADGTTYLQAAEISVRVETSGTVSSSSMPGRMMFSTTADGESSPTERMRISANGNLTVDTDTFFVDAVNNRVGIGTTSGLVERLHVNGGVRLDVDNQGIYFNSSTTSISGNGTNSEIYFYTSNVEKARIDSDGRLGLGASDLSAYELDADDLVIKQDSGNAGLTIHSASTGVGSIYFADGTTGTEGYRGRIEYNQSEDKMYFGTASTGSRVTIDDSGNVGIAETSPSDYVPGTGIVTLALKGTSSSHPARSGAVVFISQDGTTSKTQLYANTGFQINSQTATPITFHTDAEERVRIDSSGRLLVGTNISRSTGSDESAVQIEGTDSFDSALSLTRNSNSNNGPYLYFAKSRGTSLGSNTIVQDGDSLGRIRWSGADNTDANSLAGEIDCRVNGTPGSNDMPGALVFSTTAESANSPTEAMRITSNQKLRLVNGNAIFSADSARCGILFSSLTAWLPTNTAGNLTDNTCSLGAASYRMSVLYAGTGTINTSDANLKQDIDDLDAAELSVATVIKGLVKKYRFKDAVETKGADARIHVGVVAQEVEQAFIDAGLDPNRYALFCRDTWYEVGDTELTNNTPEDEVTADTPGAVEKTRLGIRYDELLAFVIAAL